MKIQAYPEYLFDPSTRHMLSVAHQDDEIMYCGLIQRWGEDCRFLWTTNGDGLAPFVNADPKEYAEIRKAETDAVLTTLGRSLSLRRCMDYSEIEIYDNFVDLTLAPQRTEEIMDFFYKIGCEIYREIKEFNPDVVWSGAFQNGHPEHDLVHFLSGYAIRQINSEQEKQIAFYHLPEYEYTILLPFRFHPRYKGIIHAIELTEKEVEVKAQALQCYPSQVDLFTKFERVFNGLGKLSGLLGKPFTAEDFLKKEIFSKVPDDIDYTKSTHWFEFENYIGDKNKNIKVRFDRHVGAIAARMRDRPFA